MAVPAEGDFAGVEDDGAVGQLEGRDGVLLDDDGGDAQRLDRMQDAFDLVDDDRRQPLIGLVEQQQLEVAGQRAGDGQHLLLAARKRDALLLAPFGKARKALVDLLEAPAIAGRNLGEGDVLLDGQARQ